MAHTPRFINSNAADEAVRSQAAPGNWLSRLFFGEAVVAVARSLRDTPEQWEVSGAFHLKHPSGVWIWTGNDPYGLEICDGWMGPKLWGGVTGLSSIALSPGHHLLSSALKRWRLGRRGTLAARLAEAQGGGVPPAAQTPAKQSGMPSKPNSNAADRTLARPLTGRP